MTTHDNDKDDTDETVNENEKDRRGFLTSVLKTSAVLGGVGVFPGIFLPSSLVAQAAAAGTSSTALPIMEQGNLPDLPKGTYGYRP